MKLTQEIAEKHIGQYIDSHRRIPGSGYWPKQIIRPEGGSGEIVLKDPTGTCVRVTRDSYYFDYFIVGRIEEA